MRANCGQNDNPIERMSTGSSGSRRIWSREQPSGYVHCELSLFVAQMRDSLSRIAARQPGEAWFEIAAAVAFLASDDASFITASTFLVDGGISGAYVTPL